MLAKIKTLFILILMAGIAFLLFQGSTFLDSKLENKPTQWIQEEPIIAPVTKTPEQVSEQVQGEVNEEVALATPIDTNSDEISNNDYDWLGGIGHDCYPGLPADVKAAFANDDMIRKNEYTEIMTRCADYMELQDAGAKGVLRKMVQ